MLAYIKIWNEWFRDENLQDSVTEIKGDGPDASTLYPMQQRGKRHDYFTSCLPYATDDRSAIMPELAAVVVSPIDLS